MTAYDGLTAATADEQQWAFGTGFAEPLLGVDTAVPEGVDARDLGAYCLMLGDDALVLSQRLTEWVGRAPVLEEEMALANCALDLLGQARLLLARAGSVGAAEPVRHRVGPDVADEDALAYFRDAEEFRCVGLAATPGGDFAQTMAQLLVASTWRLAVLTRLSASRDPVLAAVAARAVHEVTYHRDHAVHWVLRLGDGTPESHRRMQTGVEAVWPRLAELFTATDVERRLVGTGVAVDPATVRAEVREVLTRVLAEATLAVPAWPVDASPRGRVDRHGPDLAPLLDQLQRVAREHPAATW